MGTKKPRSLTTSGFFGVASIKDAQYVLYRLNRCHPQKVNKIKGFRVFETVLSASLIDATLHARRVFCFFTELSAQRTYPRDFHRHRHSQIIRWFHPWFQCEPSYLRGVL